PRDGRKRRDHPQRRRRAAQPQLGLVLPMLEDRRLRAADDRGVTVIEVVIAVVLLAASAIAVLGLVDAAGRNGYRAAQGQVLNDRLQQEVETIKRVPYDQVALTSLPAHS